MLEKERLNFWNLDLLMICDKITCNKRSLMDFLPSGLVFFSISSKSVLFFLRFVHQKESRIYQVLYQFTYILGLVCINKNIIHAK